MTAKDPHLVKTPIDSKSDDSNNSKNNASKTDVANNTPNTAQNTAQNTVRTNKASTIDEHTEVNKGTESLDTANTKHVDKRDDPARQPDRRDQEGSTPFDGNVNEETMGQGEEASDEINDYNRYANIDNAQKRVLNVDERDDS